MRERIVPFAVALVAAAFDPSPGEAAAQAASAADWRADVSAAAHALVDAGVTPGIGVAITVGDWVMFAEGFGVADLATGRPRPATLRSTSRPPPSRSPRSRRRWRRSAATSTSTRP